MKKHHFFAIAFLIWTAICVVFCLLADNGYKGEFIHGMILLSVVSVLLNGVGFAMSAPIKTVSKLDK